MKLIEEIESRLNKKGHKIKWGKFLCPICLQEVEKIRKQGLKDKSCGCNRFRFLQGNKIALKHGMVNTRLYHIWEGIKGRCLNLNHSAYSNYGDRGITICDEWLNFIPFRDWSLSHGYADNLTIDRKENEGNYEPNNCQWIPGKENSRKQRTNKVKNMEMANEIRGLAKTGNYTQKELAIKYNVTQSSISQIITNKRWKIE